MASPRELRDRDLDAVGHAVTGLPTAAAASDAVRFDQLTAETAARVAGDAAHPGTITALTGDVTASGTGAVAATLANLPQAVLLARLAALTSDPAFNAHKLTSIGDGSSAQDALAFHQLGDALTAQAFSVANAAALVGVTAGDGALRYVQTYRDLWRIDKSGTSRTAIPHQVLQSTVNAAWWWVRLGIADPFWQAQTAWYVDPAGTNSTPGNDEADGLTSSTPIKSIAEWRRRNNGAAYNVTGPTIHALSSSTNADDGLFTGFSTRNDNSATWVRLVAAPVLTGVSGTVGSYVAYSGNTRGQFTDSSIPTSWTASGAISSPSGSRWARRVGSGARHYAPLLKDLGSKTVQFGHVVDWDETDTITIAAAETNFTNGDSYEVVSFLSWPPIQSMSGSVRVQCLDIKPAVVAPDFSQGFSNAINQYYTLCGFPQNCQFFDGAGQTVVYSAVFCAASPSGIAIASTALYLTNCSAVNTVMECSYGVFPLSTTSLIFVSSEFRGFHGAIFGSLGNMRFFDCATPLISMRHMSLGKATVSIVGSGNTGSLVNCDSGGVLSGASFITATTSKALPWTVNGVDYAAPVVDGLEAIYN